MLAHRQKRRDDKIMLNNKGKDKDWKEYERANHKYVCSNQCHSLIASANSEYRDFENYNIRQ